MSSPAMPWEGAPGRESTRYLVDSRWDRVFVWGGVALVPVPILCHLALQAMGVPVGVSEDLVTLLVMLPLGGPHVLATLQRTLFDRRFWQHERWLAAGSVLVLLTVAWAAIASAFFDLAIAGRPVMTYLLTFFFFWAGLHVLQQHTYVARRLGERQLRRRVDVVDHAVILLSLYPVSLFRMSMARDDGSAGAAPDALATQIVRGLGGSDAFADAYVFRIGRATPVLPEFLLHPVWWILVTIGFVIAAAVFVAKSVRARQRGEAFGSRGRLVTAAAVAGAVAPLFPSLDVAFQGINAWHSFQYLGLVMWLRSSNTIGGEQPASAAWTTWRRQVVATLLLVVAILAFAWVLQAVSGGRFLLFGHEVPPTDGTGRPLYRPGSVLLGYYLLGFGFLLVHYLCDTVRFCRRSVA
jgi:hypothetical protein